jgi:alpha-tubulin suppressor-like RCC1 family protein
LANIPTYNVKKIAAGGNYSMAISIGEAFAWGAVMAHTYSGDGTPIGSGDSTSVIKYVPTATVGSAWPVTDISCSFTNGMTVAASGLVYVFGDNSYYQIGDGTTTNRLSYTQNTILTSTTAAPALKANELYSTVYAGTGNSFARTNYGRYVMWGDNYLSLCGTGLGWTGAYNNFACQIYLTNRVLSSTFFSTQNTKPHQIAGVNYNFVILGTDGCDYQYKVIVRSVAGSCNPKLFSWGSNSYGQLNDGTRVDQYAPVPFNNTLFESDYLVEVRQASNYFLGLTKSGKLYGWGYSDGITLSDVPIPSSNAQLYPIEINAGASSALYNQTVVTMRCGETACIALLRDNILVGFGYAATGVIGFPATTTRSLPTIIEKGRMGESMISTLEMGNQHAIILTTSKYKKKY